MRAKIIKILSKDYTILSADHSTKVCSLAGRLRLKDRPVIGDEVLYEEKGNDTFITEILPRRNALIRPACANIDQALIIMSVKDPDFSETLIDRLVMLICYENVEPILCVTKCDLGISEETEQQIQTYERGPMRTIRTGKNLLNEEIKEVLKGKVTVLTGQSGAGKSSLLNQLDPSFHIATQEISKALGRGKHTTRHSELLPVQGGLVADTPGFSSLDFSHIPSKQLAWCVPDFLPYLGQCKYTDCVHQNEPGCAVKKAVEEGKITKSRYENYQAVLTMIQNKKESYL